MAANKESFFVWKTEVPPQPRGFPMRGQKNKNAHFSNMKIQRVDSLRAAASTLDVQLSVIKKAKNDGCGAFKNTRVDIVELRKWLEQKKDEYRDVYNNENSVDALEIRKLLAQCQKIEIDNEIRMQNLLKREDVIATQVRVFSAIRTDLEALESIAPQIVGLPTHEVAKRIRDHVRDALQQLADCKWIKHLKLPAKPAE